MIYLELFYTFFIIGAFTFGGGYAMLSLIQNEVVVEHEWISAQQFTEIVAISQMTPGPIGINSATYIGYSVTGNVFGSLLATTAVMLPSFIILFDHSCISRLVLTICKLYNKFKENNHVAHLMTLLKPMVIGMIAAAAGILVTKENFFNWSSWALFAAAFVALQWGKVNPIIVIIVSGLIGIVIY